MVMDFVKLLVLISCAFTSVSTHAQPHRKTLTTRVKALEEHVNRLEKKITILTKKINHVEPVPIDCEDVRNQRQEATIESGLYLVGAPGLLKRRIYCEFTEQETWTTISRRINEEDIFNRTWTEYKNGFGKASGDYWIGNEMLYRITNLNDYYLRITLDGAMFGKKTSSYKSFRITGNAFQYRLRLGEYDSANSNGGDSFFPITADCNKNNYTGAAFSTYDYGDAKNCAKTLSGGWWFTDCGCSNLNGKYVRGGSVPTRGPNIGLYWDTLYRDHWGLKSSLRKVTMEIRRIKVNQNNKNVIG